jgi:hypothetical protein
MKRKALRTIALSSFALVVMPPAAWGAPAREAKTPYPSMAPRISTRWSAGRDNAGAERCTSIHLAGY